MSAPRYETLLRLASGGMATVWIGTARGALGFRQLVAIKKPHPHLLIDPALRNELVAEARLASMIRHANVVDVRDVEIDGDEISLIMDYIEGASVGDLLVAAHRNNATIPVRTALRIVRDACAGLHAAHELIDEKNRPVGLVHRDISPQNVLVGTDGIARVTDFGVAKFARKDAQSTSEGSLKGKLAYMAPEYVRGEPIDRRFDVFAMGVVLWEMLAGKRCFRGDNEADTLRRLLDETPAPPSSFDPTLAPLDSVLACALAKDRQERFQNAAAMGAALEGAANPAGLLGSHTEVAAALKDLVGPALEERRALVRDKLAHEPSIASLMGVSPLDLPPALGGSAPPDHPPGHATLRDGPPPEMPAGSTLPGGSPATKAASTPKMGGGGGVGGSFVTAPLAAAPVPSTLPMTPALGPLPIVTLPSATPLALEPAPPIQVFNAAPTGTTLRSEEEGDRDRGAPRAPASDPAPASAQTGDPAFPPSSFPLPPPPRRSLVPAALAVGALAVLAVGIGVFASRRASVPPVTAATTAASSSLTSPAPLALASASAPLSSPPPSPSPAGSGSTAILDHKPAAQTAPRATVRPPVTARPTPAPRPSAAPAPSPVPVPTSTSKKPPDNPYN